MPQLSYKMDSSEQTVVNSLDTNKPTKAKSQNLRIVVFISWPHILLESSGFGRNKSEFPCF